MTETVRNEKRQAMVFRGSSPPDASDTGATVRWLRDRELIKDLYARYAYGIDSADMELVRSVFHPDCVVVGTLEGGSLGDYLDGIEQGVLIARIDGDWKITRREAAEQWHTGPFPRPFIGDPPYPRRPRIADATGDPLPG